MKLKQISMETAISEKIICKNLSVQKYLQLKINYRYRIK